MISGKEIKVLDENSEYLGTPTIDLMENAGKGVADFILNKLKIKEKKILVCCGPGNNGGDGFVAARYVAKNNKVVVFFQGEKCKSDIAQQNLTRLQKQKIPIISSVDEFDSEINKNDIIIDALLGIGILGELRKPYSSLVKKINEASNKTIISVDIPSGLGTNQSVHPKYTITFHDSKIGMNEQNSGEIHVVNINIPKDAETYVGPGELKTYYPKPKKDSHKGENGRVLVIGGGPYTGAPALSGLAAMRTGADLVTIATPKRSWLSIASFSPNLIVKDLNSNVLIPGDIHIIRELLPKCDAVVIGPGLGGLKETQETIIKVIGLAITENKPLVIDADAIQAVGNQPTILKGSHTVITPHQGEFKKLTGIDLPDDIETRTLIIKEWANKLDISILLKAPVDILTNGKDSRLNKIHNEGMTVGGTGDVLAGIIGALLSKGVESYNAIRIAAFLNGEAGNFAFKKHSYGLLATDIIDEIPQVLIKYL